jgi:CBS domain-containing protein
VLAVGFAVASFFGPNMLLFIAIFVFIGAQQELAYARFRSGAASRRVSDVMFADYSSFPAGMPASQALGLARAANQGIFPVVDHQLRAIGIVSVKSLEESVSAGFSARPVDTLARPVSRISASDSLDAVMGTLAPGIPVVVENSSGQIVGLLAART